MEGGLVCVNGEEWEKRRLKEIFKWSFMHLRRTFFVINPAPAKYSIRISPPWSSCLFTKFLGVPPSMRRRCHHVGVRSSSAGSDGGRGKHHAGVALYPYPSRSLSLSLSLRLNLALSPFCASPSFASPAHRSGPLCHRFALTSGSLSLSPLCLHCTPDYTCQHVSTFSAKHPCARCTHIASAHCGHLIFVYVSIPFASRFTQIIDTRRIVFLFFLHFCCEKLRRTFCSVGLSVRPSVRHSVVQSLNRRRADSHRPNWRRLHVFVCVVYVLACLG